MIKIQYLANSAGDVAVTMSDIKTICAGPVNCFLLFVLLVCDGFQTTSKIFSFITFISG